MLELLDPVLALLSMSETRVLNAVCKPEGALPLLTCEIRADRSALHLLVELLVPVLVLDELSELLPDALSLFMAWNSECMNAATSFCVLLAVLPEPLVPSQDDEAEVLLPAVLSVPLLVLLLELLLALVPDGGAGGAGSDSPRL